MPAADTPRRWPHRAGLKRTRRRAAPARDSAGAHHTADAPVPCALGSPHSRTASPQHSPAPHTRRRRVTAQSRADRRNVRRPAMGSPVPQKQEPDAWRAACRRPLTTRFQSLPEPITCNYPCRTGTLQTPRTAAAAPAPAAPATNRWTACPSTSGRRSKTIRVMPRMPTMTSPACMPGWPRHAISSVITVTVSTITPTDSCQAV